MAAAFLGQGAAPQIVYSEFRPTVIRSDRTQPVLFTAKISGTASRVALEVNGIEREMRDDATNGDVTAGDTVYTLSLPANEIVQKLTPSDMFRPFVGFLNIYQLSTRVFRGNIFAEVITDDIPRLPVRDFAPDAQATASLFNVVDPQFVTGDTADITRITKKFYEYFPDDFDFINLVWAITRFQNRTHFAVRNDVRGIGLSVFNNSSVYGSKGKLLGISRFPISSVFDGAETGYQHELGHQWINFLSGVPALASGVPHWPISSLASGMMGFSIPPTGEGGTYACLLTPEAGGIRLTPRIGSAVFNDLELYMMGLLPPDQVGEHIVFVNQAQAQTQPCSGLFTGPTIKVSIADIVGAVGPRVPDSTVSQRHFKAATIIVSKDGLLNADEMSFYSFFSKRAEETREVPFQSGFSKGIAKPFAISTGGRASLDVGLLDSLPITYTVAPRGGFSRTSAGQGTADMAVGSGHIVRGAGTSAPSGLAILALRQNNTLVSEATVPASTTLTAGRIFAETAGRVRTGVAIANPNNQDITLSFYFTNELGQNVSPGSTVIPAYGQIARFLDDTPFNGGSPMLGSFTFVASAPVVAVAIRGYFTERSEFLMTTLSVIDLSLPASTDTVVLPHFAVGGGFTTQFVLVNPGDSTLNGTLQFYSQGSVNPVSTPGIPVAVEVDGQSAISFDFTIPPRSSRRLQTTGTAIQSGSVRFVSSSGSAAPSVLGIFSYRLGGVLASEAGIPAIPASTAYRVYVESAGTLGVPGSIQSGLAIANTSASPVTVALELRNMQGTPAGNVETVTVPANGQVAMFLESLGSFSSVADPFQGVLRISSPSPGIFALGLRARYNERGEFLMTTTGPTIEGAAVPNADLFFPHVVDSGGFTTQFILFDGYANQSFSGSLEFFTQDGQRFAPSFP